MCAEVIDWHGVSIGATPAFGVLTGGTPIAIAVLCTAVQHSVTQFSHSRYSIPGDISAAQGRMVSDEALV
jgi:hypothetical protein